MLDNFNNKTDITHSSAATATANIMVSDKAGDWVTFQANTGWNGMGFITLRVGHVINTTAFGHKDIDKCNKVEITYFAGEKVVTACINSTLAEVHKALGITSNLMLTNQL